MKDDLAKVAQNVTLILASRLMAVIGVPVAGIIFSFAWGKLDEATKAIGDLRTTVAVIRSNSDTLQMQVQNIDSRVIYLERLK